MALVERLDGVEAIMVTKDEKILTSPGLKGSMTVANLPAEGNPFASINK